MRKFYDLLVSADLLTPETLSYMRELGFSGVGASISAQLFLKSPEAAMKMFEQLRERGREEGLDVVTRLSIDVPMKESLAKKILRRWRTRVELITVHAMNRQLTAFACRDTRVDILTLVPGARLLKGDLMYMKEYGKRVELLLAPLQEGDVRVRASTLSYYLAVLGKLTRGRRPDISLLFSSGATEVRSLRDARSMAALLHTMGVPYEYALDALSKNALDLVTENREKLAGIIPVRGVKIIGKESTGGFQ
ncbi:MAG: RNase P subunit p30 family protein [Thermofilaceae archaeon]